MGGHLLVPIVRHPVVWSTPSAPRTAGANGGKVVPGFLFPGLAPRPHSDTKRMPPWGGGRGSAKWGLVAHASLIISLATAAAKLLVGGVFFFSLLGGGFLLASPWRWGALGSGSVPCFLRVIAPGVCGFLRPPGAQFRNMPSQTPHMLKMPALGGTEINSDFIWGKASTLSSSREQNVVKPCAHFMV